MANQPGAGQVIAGYRLESVIGRGGMGVVYLAEHERLHRKAAVKVLSPEFAGDDGFRERFVRESTLAASLDHPNIVPIYDAGEADGVLYLVMRYIRGFDLQTLIAREGPLETGRAAAVAVQVAGALDAAHAASLIHRDVKPANILLTTGHDGREHAILLDFGLARDSAYAGLTRTGQMIGTIEYIAPEVIEGKPIDRRVDIYALGCVVYESLVGTPPFRRDSQLATLWAHVNSGPPDVRDARPDLPEAITPVLARGMAKDPNERYATAGALAAEAASALAGATEVQDMPPASVVSAAAAGAGGAAAAAATTVIGAADSAVAAKSDAVTESKFTGAAGAGAIASAGAGGAPPTVVVTPAAAASQPRRRRLLLAAAVVGGLAILFGAAGLLLANQHGGNGPSQPPSTMTAVGSNAPSGSPTSAPTAGSSVGPSSSGLPPSSGPSSGPSVGPSSSIGLPDTVGPTTTATVNGGAQAVDSLDVTLDISSIDPSGVSGLRIANSIDDLATAQEIPYASEIDWTLDAGGAGTRTVYILARDSLGNWALEPVVIQITYSGTGTGSADAPVCYAIDGVKVRTSQQKLIAADCDGDDLTYHIDAQPSAGRILDVTGIGFLYEAGTTAKADSFTYHASNGGQSSKTVKVSLTITDATTPDQAPTCDPLRISNVEPGKSGSVNISCGNTPGITSIDIPRKPAHGTVAVSGRTLTYSANTNATGSDSFTYSACVNTDCSDPAKVSVTIKTTATTNSAPVCNAATITLDVGESKSFTCSDADGDTLSYEVLTGPSNGTVTYGSKLKYTAGTKAGSDEFTYRASDRQAKSAVVTVSVTINAPTTSWKAGRFNAPTSGDIAPDHTFTWGAGSGFDGVSHYGIYIGTSPPPDHCSGQCQYGDGDGDADASHNVAAHSFAANERSYQPGGLPFQTIYVRLFTYFDKAGAHELGLPDGKHVTWRDYTFNVTSGSSGVRVPPPAASVAVLPERPRITRRSRPARRGR